MIPSFISRKIKTYQTVMNLLAMAIGGNSALILGVVLNIIEVSRSTFLFLLSIEAPLILALFILHTLMEPILSNLIETDIERRVSMLARPLQRYFVDKHRESRERKT